MKPNRQRILGDLSVTARSPLANIQSLVFFLVPIVYVVQNPTFDSYQDIESGLRPYHIFAALIFLVSAYRASRSAILLSVVFILVVTAANFFAGADGLNSRMIAAGGFVAMFLGAAGAGSVDRRFARQGALVALVLLALTTLWQLPTIISTAAVNSEGRALYPTLMAGGINIQASTFVILYILISSAKMLSTTAVLLVTFILTQTRAIFLVIPALMLNGLRRRKEFGGVRKNLFAVAGAGVALIGVLYFNVVDVSKLAERVVNIFSGDSGTSGRMLLYSIAFANPQCYLAGCGLGSAAELIAQPGYFSVYEDNFHNVYLQMVIETGFPGLTLYCSLLGLSYFQARSRLGDDGLATALLAIAIMSFVQFNGFELITAFLIGLGFSRMDHAPFNSRLRKPR